MEEKEIQVLFEGNQKSICLPSSCDFRVAKETLQKAFNVENIQLKYTGKIGSLQITVSVDSGNNRNPFCNIFQTRNGKHT